MENEQILDNFNEDDEKLFIPASKGKRLANYIIDAIVFYLLVAIIGMFAFILGDADPDATVEWIDNSLLSNLISIIAYIWFYIFFEALLKGKTIGKLITRTRVVDIGGNPPSLYEVVIRSLSRIVPFEGFSFLGSDPYGWHDKWSKTMVIDVNKSSF